MQRPSTGLEIRLASRPTGWPSSDNFQAVSAAAPALAPGQVLVRNTVMWVDPSMRGRMNDGPVVHRRPSRVDAALGAAPSAR